MNAKATELPWWTWVVPVFVLHMGSEVSVLLRYDQGVSAYYLPTAISIVLIQWWGPWRVLPAVFLNATLSTSLWGVARIYLWPVYAFTDVIAAFLSWYLFSKIAQGKCWLPDIKQLLLFLSLGIITPMGLEILYLQGVQIYFGDQSADQFINHTIINLLSEFTVNFGLTPPILYFGTPFMKRFRLLNTVSNIEKTVALKRSQYIEIGIMYVITFSMTIFLTFERFWFIYGFFSLYAAIRFGFGQAILMNAYIFLITYLLPLLLQSKSHTYLEVDMQFVFVHVGTTLLYLFSAITGRVISDLKRAEERLTAQNAELEITNKELDRFVYSVSHDLSAPLKSILGLVNISRLSNNHEEQVGYISKIESSVLKLESFIKEILDYSRDKRQELFLEQIQLRDLCTEILDGLKFLEGYHRIQMDMEDLKPVELRNDKTRLKIIINNLLANAILFQKKFPEHKPFIKISSRQIDHTVILEIADNGEGIKPDYQNKIFDMFFRGTTNSSGSGLGLYIAREAASKIDGKILVQSEFGKGSTFIVELKDLNHN
ncbi:MAG TPA: ATP-binding protein [Cyclobacteriaceae bacterium]|nr:ATP-binding protein [Cyclobacteriaceae bacterium]